ncbi:MAG: hypothetical protein QG664_414, partial [Patescibacteria group bacterium]|nr:hypothetical protein [Patescibacteria group bacterium]
FGSKEHRDQVNAEVMKEMGEQMKDFDQARMPVDMKRVADGGFKVEVEG